MKNNYIANGYILKKDWVTRLSAGTCCNVIKPTNIILLAMLLHAYVFKFNYCISEAVTAILLGHLLMVMYKLCNSLKPEAQ